MPTTSTSIHETILAIVEIMDAAVSYKVFDGPPSKLPNRAETKFLVIGAEVPLTDDNDSAHDAATMSQVWSGMGPKRRTEEIRINCVAVGKSSTVATARGLAVGVIDDVADNIGIRPGNEGAYNTLVADISTTRVRNVSGGAVVQIQFIITASANLF